LKDTQNITLGEGISQVALLLHLLLKETNTDIIVCGTHLKAKKGFEKK